MTDQPDPFREIIADNTTAPELTELAKRLAVLKTRLQMIEDEEKKARGNYEQVEAELFDAMENAGLRQIRTGEGLFSLNDLAWAKIEDPEKAKAWADQNMPELLTLNNQRLSKIVRDILKGEAETQELPDGVGFTTSRKITWRRR